MSNAQSWALDLPASPGSEPFYVAIHRPGSLQFFESGPFASADVSGAGFWRSRCRNQRRSSVSFDPGTEPAADLPFDGVTLDAQCQEYSGSSYSERGRGEWPSGPPTAGNGRSRTGDLPGSGRQRGRNAAEPSRHLRRLIRGIIAIPRTSFSRAESNTPVEFRFTPLDRNLFRGSSAARIRIVNFDGSPAASRPVKVSYHDRHYGDLEVFAGPTSRSGEFEISRNHRPDIGGHLVRPLSDRR